MCAKRRWLLQTYFSMACCMLAIAGVAASKPPTPLMTRNCLRCADHMRDKCVTSPQHMPTYTRRQRKRLPSAAEFLRPHHGLCPGLCWPLTSQQSRGESRVGDKAAPNRRLDTESTCKLTVTCKCAPCHNLPPHITSYVHAFHMWCMLLSLQDPQAIRQPQVCPHSLLGYPCAGGRACEILLGIQDLSPFFKAYGLMCM